MTQNVSDGRISTMQLIAVPALITLAVTVLRLIGEMRGWSKVWFNPAPGGGGGLVGIVWLVPIFGVYFALKLSNAGEGPESPGRAALIAFLGLVITAIGFVGAFAVSQPGRLMAQLVVGMASVIAIVLIQRKAWPALARTLLAYGFAARIPVAIIMFFAIRGSWGTHYDGPPPNFPSEMAWFPKYILIGLLPQLVMWIAFTVIVGTLFGAAAVAVTHRGRQTSATPA
jgi:hypothetical protein